MINITDNILYCKESQNDDNLDIESLFEVNDFKEFTNQFIIVENFYKNPNIVSDYAKHSYDYSIKFPYGNRSNASYLNDGLENKIKKHVNIFDENLDEKFFKYHKDNGTFLYTRQAINKLWIHKDDSNTANWAGVIYMTNRLEDFNYGTTFYILNHNGDNNYFLNKEELESCVNIYKWFTCDKIGHKFNKFVMYKSNIYHTISKNFGDNKYNCRITQTFFFKTT